MGGRIYRTSGRRIKTRFFIIFKIYCNTRRLHAIYLVHDFLALRDLRLGEAALRRLGDAALPLLRVDLRLVTFLGDLRGEAFLGDLRGEAFLVGDLRGERGRN